MKQAMDVVGTIGAIWLAVSILLALAWALGGRKIFRKPPVQPTAAPVIRLDGKRVDEALRRNGGA